MKQRRLQGTFLLLNSQSFSDAAKFTENEMNLSAQHGFSCDYSWSLAVTNPHVPLFALSKGLSTFRQNQKRCTADGHMTNGFIAPLWRFES